MHRITGRDVGEGPASRSRVTLVEVLEAAKRVAKYGGERWSTIQRESVDTGARVGLGCHQIVQPEQSHECPPPRAVREPLAPVHGIAELTRTKRFPRSRQKERVRVLVELFNFPR